MTLFGSHRLYRSRHGKFLGVCRGLADWKDFPVDMVRLFFILAFIFTGFFPVAVFYIIAAFFLPLEPYGSDRKDDFQSRAKRDPGETFRDIKREFSSMKDRVGRMEDEVVNKEKEWDQKFRDEK